MRCENRKRGFGGVGRVWEGLRGIGRAGGGGMKPGSVMVDLAAFNGGNTASTVTNEVVIADNG